MWAGFAVFAGAYSMVALATCPLTAPSLLTSWGLSLLEAAVTPARIDSNFDFIPVCYFNYPPAPTINPVPVPRSQVGQCVAALIGAGVAVLLGRSDEAPER